MQNESLTEAECRQLLDFGLSIVNLATPDAWARLIETLAALGFRRCLYGFIPDHTRSLPGDPPGDIMVVMSSYDAEFMEMYREHSRSINHACVSYALRNKAPTLMSRLADLCDDPVPMPPAVAAWLADYSRRTNMFEGVLVPLRGPIFSMVGGATVIVDPATDPQTAQEHALRHMPLVAELINMFHQSIEFSHLLPRERHLTAREREILRWLAKGLPTKQIAERTGTAQSTVEKQLASARRRLAAGNNANLLLKAMAYGLL